MADSEGSGTDTQQTGTERIELSDEEWRQRLSPERYAVLRQKGTEPAWSGELLHVEGSGMFTCAGCGAALFPSEHQVRLRIGLAELLPGAGRRHHRGARGRSFGMRRTEITCARCGGHLGHVFPDGPAPTGLRYCVNSLSLDYEPDAESDGRQGSRASAG